MNHTQALDLINELETSFPVSSLDYLDVPIWPIIRTNLGFELIRGDVIVEATTPDSAEPIPSPGSVKGFLKASFLDGKTCINTKRTVDALFFGNHFARIEVDGLYYDRICDPLADAYRSQGFETAHFEPLGGFERFPRYRSSYLISSTLLEIAKTLFNISTPTRYPIGIYKDLEPIYKYIESKTGTPCFFNAHRAVRVALQVFEYAAVWECILSRMRPKIVYTVLYYSAYGWALCLACKRLQIPVVELPHGRQDPSHHAYARWQKVPPEGYAVLPNAFWNWSAFEAKTIDEWADTLTLNPHRSFIGGNPYLTLWPQSTPPFAARHQTLVQRRKDELGDRPLILATPEFSCFSVEPILDTIERAPNDWFWFIRMHPTETHRRHEIADELRRRNISNAEIDLPTDAPLYCLLRYTDILYTSFSTTILEAKEFNVPSVSFSEHSKSLFQNELKSGWLSVSEDLSACVRYIEDYLSEKIHLNERSIESTTDSVPTTLKRLHCLLSVDLEMS